MMCTMYTLALANHKGGVGKTTTTHALGIILAHEYNRQVLIIDMDPQASLTGACGIQAPGKSMAEVMMGELPLEDTLVEVAEGLYLAPSDIALAHTEMRLLAKIGRENILRRQLSRLKDRFDYVLIDSPPSLGMLTINALVAADDVLIPSQPQYLDLRGLALFTETLNEVREELNPDLGVLGVLPTFWDRRLKHHNEVLTAWHQAGLPVIPVQIARSVRVAEAPVSGQSVVTYAPENPSSVAYRGLAEVIEEDR